jgi:hypothetical protein
MYKKLFSKANFEEKTNLYSLLDFMLASLSRLAELMILLLLSSGLANKLASIFSGLFEEKPIDLFLLAPMVLFFTLVVSICPALRSQLRADSGLDVRPLKTRLLIVLPYWIFGFFYLWLVSWILLMSMQEGQLILWTFTLAFSLWSLVLLEAISRHLTVKAKLRDMTSEEFPEGLYTFFEKWRKHQKGKLLVYQNFGPGLTMPTYQGQDLIVTEKALAAFQPESLKAGLVMAMVSQMLRLRRNFLVLRMVALTMAVPVSMMLLYSLGFQMGYPVAVRFSHIALVWMGCWLSYHVSNLVMNIISRILYHRLNMATIAILGQIMPLVKAIETMARYNLMPKKTPWWRSLGSPYPSPKDQIKHIKIGLSDMSSKGAKNAKDKPESPRSFIDQDVFNGHSVVAGYEDGNFSAVNGDGKRPASGQGNGGSNGQPAPAGKDNGEKTSFVYKYQDSSTDQEAYEVTDKSKDRDSSED